MEQNASKLTVFFEDPFWVGLYERAEGGRYQVCKITFGPEPRDCQVYDFLLRHWGRLTFSPAVETAPAAERRVSPKRKQRAVQRQLQAPAMGTKAQQALKLQREQGRQARRERTRAQREAEADRRFALRQEKRREKRRGR